VFAWAPIISRYAHTKGSKNPSLVLDVYMDPLSTACADSWNVLKQLVQNYGEKVLMLNVIPFSSPYHRNSFYVVQGGEVISAVNSSKWFDWLELIFKYQSEFSTSATLSSTSQTVIDRLTFYAVREMKMVKQTFVDGMAYASDYDYKARELFRYACSRGAYSTPSFYLNNVLIAGDEASVWTFDEWKAIIEGLL